MKEEANKDGLIIRNYKVIYKLVDDIKEEINSKLPEIDAEEVLGTGDVTNTQVATHLHLRKRLSLFSSFLERRRSKYTAGIQSHGGKEEGERGGLSLHERCSPEICNVSFSKGKRYCLHR